MELAVSVLNMSKFAWIVLLLHVYGGLLVSLVIKYADSIVKAFATSISIVITA